MLTSWWMNAAWAFSVLGQIGLAVTIARHRKIGRWFGLFAFCSSSAVAECVLWAIHHNYREYFYCYWTWQIAQDALRLLILVDLPRSIPGLKMMGFRIPVGVATLTLLLSGGSWHLSAIASTAFSNHLVNAALLLGRSVSFAWAGCLLALLASIAILGLGWTKDGAIIAAGLTLRVISEMLVSHLYSISGTAGRHLGMLLDSSICLMSLAIWYFGVCTDDVLPTPSDLFDASLTRHPSPMA